MELKDSSIGRSSIVFWPEPRGAPDPSKLTKHTAASSAAVTAERRLPDDVVDFVYVAHAPRVL